MGWLYMQSLKGHSGPRQYLDAQFTFERPEATSKVLRSALVGMRVYYAAVEQIRVGSGEREVWALICLVRYNPRDPEGYIFGYKDMTLCRERHNFDNAESKIMPNILGFLCRPTHGAFFLSA